MENHENTSNNAEYAKTTVLHMTRALNGIGITGQLLISHQNGTHNMIHCTIDTRGCHNQLQVNRVIAKAKKAIQSVTSMPVRIGATGHAYAEPILIEKTIEYLRNTYDY